MPTVQEGQTASEIAAAAGLSPQQFLELNPSFEATGNPGDYQGLSGLIYPGQEYTVVGPDQAQDATNQAITDLDAANQQLEDQQTTTSDEDIDIDLGDEELSEEEQELQDISDELISERENYISQLEQARATANAASQNLISQIQRSTERRVLEMQEINRRNLELQRSLGFRSGRARYAPVLQTSILSGEERAGVQRISEIEQEGLMLIAQAQQAAADRDFEMLTSIMSNREALLQQKFDTLQEIVEAQKEKEREIADKIAASRRQSSIAQFIQAGTTDPIDIFTSMVEAGFDDISIDEITELTDLVESQEEGGGVEMERFRMFFPDIDVSTPEGYQKYLQYIRDTSAAGRKGDGGGDTGSDTGESTVDAQDLEDIANDLKKMSLDRLDVSLEEIKRTGTYTFAEDDVVTLTTADIQKLINKINKKRGIFRTETDVTADE